jgi:hypothetical protein
MTHIRRERYNSDVESNVPKLASWSQGVLEEETSWRDAIMRGVS